MKITFNKNLIFTLITLFLANTAMAETFTQEDSDQQENWQSAWNTESSFLGKQKDGKEMWQCLYRADDTPSFTFQINYVTNSNYKNWRSCPDKIWFDPMKNKWKIK